MASARKSFSSFWRALTRFQKEKVYPWIAFRNTIGVTLPLIAGAAAGQLAGGIAVATGALNVAWSDSQEPYRTRAKRMLAACGLVGLAVFSGAICGHSRLAVIGVAAAWAFVAGMLVALSQTAADLGTISLVVFVVYSSVPQPIERAIYAGLLACAGGLLQTGLALALWPLRKYEPERRALRQLYTELARAAEAPVHVWQAPPRQRREHASPDYFGLSLRGSFS